MNDDTDPGSNLIDPWYGELVRRITCGHKLGAVWHAFTRLSEIECPRGHKGVEIITPDIDN